MPKTGRDSTLERGPDFPKESGSGDGLRLAKRKAPYAGVVFYDRGHIRDAAKHACDGGVALVGWFDAGSRERPDVGPRLRELRLFAFDRTELVRTARRFGVARPEIAEGLGAGVPLVRIWGGAAKRALAATGVGRGVGGGAA